MKESRVGVRDLKIEESGVKGLCTESTALVVMSVAHLSTVFW
jgi:hypothetical protein